MDGETRGVVDEISVGTLTEREGTHIDVWGEIPAGLVEETNLGGKTLANVGGERTPCVLDGDWRQWADSGRWIKA